MGICKSAQLTILNFDESFQFLSPSQPASPQQNIIPSQVSLSNSKPASEFENQQSENQIANNNPQQIPNPSTFKWAESIWNSGDTKNANQKDPQNHNNLQQIDELSKSLLKNDTQPDENTCRQVLNLRNLPQLMLESSPIKISAKSPISERTLISHEMIDSVPYRRTKANILQQ